MKRDRTVTSSPTPLLERLRPQRVVLFAPSAFRDNRTVETELPEEYYDTDQIALALDRQETGHNRSFKGVHRSLA